MQTLKRTVKRPFLCCLVIALHILTFAAQADATCTCVNGVSGQAYPAGMCCDLGSVTCDSSMQSTAFCIKDGNLCPRMVQSNAVGHFISASLSWRATGGNSVEFEIISTWRMSFSWPYPAYSSYTGPCGFPGVGDVVPIVGISAGSDGTQSSQSSTGNVAVQLLSGEGAYDLVMQVTSFSVEEDWISGITKVPVSYPSPYAAKVPFFPPGMGKYVASKGNRDTLQPYTTIPWVATFSGCCRQFQTQDLAGDGTWNFNLTAYVDLTDSLGSPRIVSLPQLWIDAPSTETDLNAVSYVTLCAISTAGVQGMYRASHGTLNYPSDDNMPAQMYWEIIDSAGASWANVQSVSNCRTLALKQASSYFRDQYLANSFTNSISIGVSIGTGCYYGRCSFATIDISLFRIPYANQGQLPILVPGTTTFTCTQATNGVYIATQGLPLNASIGFNSGCLDLAFKFNTYDSDRKALEIRYVAATAEMQSTELATAPGRLAYSVAMAGQDDAGLPPGAQLSAAYGVQDIEVAFSTTPDRVRPEHDVSFSAPQRDYASLVGNLDPQGSALLSMGYTLVANTNFNAGAPGGATIGIYVLTSQIMISSPSLTPAAVTALRLVNSSLIVTDSDGNLTCPSGEADGFTLLPRNLLEESNRGGIYLLVKRGSGAPIVRVSVDPTAAAAGAGAGWSGTYGESWQNGQMVANITLYYLTAPETTVQRTLQWTPCTSPTEMVFCAAAAERIDLSTPLPSMTLFLGQSTMRCVYFDVGPKPPPLFSRCDLFNSLVGCPPDGGCGVCGFFAGTTKVNDTYIVNMGAQMVVPVVLKNLAYVPWDLSSVSISPTSGIAGTLPPGEQGNHTGPSGAMVYGYNENNVKVLGQLFPSNANADNPDRSVVGGYVSWTPSPTDGAWKGMLCVEACVPAAEASSQCLADGGGAMAMPAPLCSTYCVKVQVGRCTWVVHQGDTIASIAAAFNTNWLQMWYLNPKILHPDYALSPVSFPQVAVGRLYLAQWDDTMNLLYRRFAITPEQIIALNADVAHLGPDDQFGDQMLCIIPNSCQDPTSTQGAQPF